MGQASLPTGYNGPWEGPLPAGWTQQDTTTYATDYDGGGENSAKFDGGDWIQIYFGSAPETASYYAKGNALSGEYAYKVQESADGSNWTDVATYGAGNPLNNSIPVQYTNSLLSSTRYVRFFYETKVQGNIGLDGVRIDGPTAPTVTFAPPGNHSVAASNLLTLAVSITPSNSGMSGWSLLPGYAGTADMTNGSFRFTPADSDSDTTFTLSVVATNFVGSTTGTVQISVTPYEPPVPVIAFSPEAPYGIMATETQQLGIAVTPDGSGIQSWDLLPACSGSASLVGTNFTFVPAESDGPADYTLSVIATNGFGSTTAAVSITVSAYVPPPVPGSYVCTFEDGTKSFYGSGDVSLSNQLWNLDGILIGTTVDDLKFGNKSGRLKYEPESYSLTMTSQETLLSNGIGRISLWYGPYGTHGTNAPTLAIEISESLDSGWSEVGAFDAGAVTNLTYYSADAYVSWPVYVRLRAKSGVSSRSANFDDIAITPYPADWPPEITFSPAAPYSIMATATQQLGIRVTPIGGGIQSWTLLPSNYAGSATLVETNFSFTPAQADAPGTYTLTIIATNSATAATGTVDIAVLPSYAIAIAPPTNGAVATVPANAAAAGTLVTIATTPDAGYAQGPITVVDSNLTPVAVTGNSFAMPESAVTVNVGFVPAHAITIAPLTHGSLTTLPTSAAGEGNIVTLLPTPDIGFELESIAVVDASSNLVPVTNAMFTMPTSAVTISATFSLIPLPVSTHALRFENFNAWDESAYESQGNHSRSGWTIQNGCILPAGGVLNTRAALLTQSNSAVVLPAFEDGTGEVRFWSRVHEPGQTAYLLLQTSFDAGSNWIDQASFTVTTAALHTAWLYVTNAAHTRIIFDPAQHSGDVVMDNIEARVPNPRREQNFDVWPTKYSYITGTATHQGWFITNCIVDGTYAYQGQAARLYSTTGNYIRSPELPEGIGTIRFRTRKWLASDPVFTLQIQASPDGTSWTALTNVSAASTNYQQVGMYLYDTTNHYVRFYHSAGNVRVLLDDICIRAPQPRPDVLLTHGFDPPVPLADEPTTLIACADPLYGASILSVTGYYRIAMAAWNPASMDAVESGCYAALEDVPGQPFGTMICCYAQVQYAGFGADPGSAGYSTTLVASAISTNYVSTQTFRVVTVQGNFIATNNPPPNMMRVENTPRWESDHHITNVGPVTFRFVSDLDGVSWGASNIGPAIQLPAGGIMSPGATNHAAVTVDEPGRYQITFNHLTGAYTVTHLYSDDSQGTPPNLLKNPGFERTTEPDGGEAVDWSALQAWPRRAIDGYAPHSGSGCGVMHAQWFPEWSTNAFFAQDVAVGEGRTYQASAWIRATPDWTADSAQLKLEWKDAEGASLGKDSITTISSLPTGWVKVAVEDVAPTNAFQARFIILGTGIGTTGSMQVDDVELRVVGPTSYYAAAYGLSGANLRLALRNIISEAQFLGDGSFHAYYPTTDARADGLVWDMYSDNPNGTPPYIYPFDSCEQAGSGRIEGDVYGDTYSWPGSWCNYASPASGDLFQIYPADVKVAMVRSGYPYGEVTRPHAMTLNGGKLGSCSTPGYADTVFEPLDQYKGDFARSYFYMSTRYFGEDQDWNANPAVTGAELNPWLLEMLLRWHEDDPVSWKELARNEAVYALQGNRNPFIDYPEWVQDIWGTATNRALPRIAIDSPAALLSSVPADGIWTVQGRVSSEVAGVVIWSNSTTRAAGSIALTGTNFLLSGVPLAYGQNQVHLMVSNSLEQTAGRSLVVFRQTGARETFDHEEYWSEGLCDPYWYHEFTSLEYVSTNGNLDWGDFIGAEAASKRSVNMDANGFSWELNPSASNAMVRYRTSHTLTNFSVYLAPFTTNSAIQFEIRISTNSGASYEVLLATNQCWFDGALQYKKFGSPPLFASPEPGLLTYVEILKTDGEMIFVDDFDYSPAPALDDLDADGLPDDWEIFYFRNITTSDGQDDYDGDGLIDIEEFHCWTSPMLKDTDHDGQSDWEEFIAGTEGFTDSDTFAIREMSPASEMHAPLVLYWDSATGRTYRLFVGMSLTGDWSAATQVLNAPGDGQQMSYTNEAFDRMGFFRLTVEKP